MSEFRTDRFTWNEGDINLTMPNQLQCVDCRFRSARTSKCERFPKLKPKYVLDKEKDCPEYQKE